jgi:hypothetical protein
MYFGENDEQVENFAIGDHRRGGLCRGPGARVEPHHGVGSALTPETFEAVKTRVLPSASDLAWQQVDWRDGYFEGVLEAQRQDKPIFYWIYEGDPRGGC